MENEEVLYEKQGPDARNKKIDELIEGLNKFGQSVREIIFSVTTNHTNSISTEEEREREKRLLHLVERRLSEKVATHIEYQEMMHEKVMSLESQISKLMERENHQFRRENSQSKLEGMTAFGSLFDSTRSGGDWKELDVESFDSLSR